MKKISLFILLFTLNSCKSYLPGFDFESFSNTPISELAEAVEDEDVKAIEKFVRIKRYEIDYRDPLYGHSLLMLAVANNLEDSIRNLLELGANPNLRSAKSDKIDNITTPTFIACDRSLNKSDCDTNILMMMIEFGGAVDDRIEVKYVGADYTSYTTPLMEASNTDCIEIIKVLIQAGADINSYD